MAVSYTHLDVYKRQANLLLHYLHRAFPYKTDEAQFGVERTLFAEEMFHYPYSDCEDRSILFARLVRDLMKTVSYTHLP